MTKLTILRGLSGSGKSTWARQQNALVVSRDDIRVMLYGSDGPDYYQSDNLREREDTVTVVQNGMIDAGLRAGKDVVVDNTNIEWRYVKDIAKIGWRHGAEVETKVFDVSLDEACTRDQIRGGSGGRRVGRDIIYKQHERFAKTKNLTLPEVVPPAPYHGTPGKPKAFLVDIDGTLAHMNDKRGPFEWHNVGLDDVDEVITNIVWDIWAGSQERSEGDYMVIVMSGRDEVCREKTAEWLDSAAVPWTHLFMRPANDMRPDNIVKAELFDNYVRDDFDVQFVLDDRQQVVDMWRAMGLTCLQVAPGDF